MTVTSFVFSTQSGGGGVPAPANAGTVSNTGATQTLPVYITHDSTDELSECGVFIQPYAGGGYVGLNGPSADYAEILAWGTWGTRGVLVNMDAMSTDPSYDVCFATDTGSKSTNAIPLDTAAFVSGLSTSDGLFPAGDTALLAIHLSPPPEATNVGIRQFSLFMKYLN